MKAQAARLGMVRWRLRAAGLLLAVLALSAGTMPASAAAAGGVAPQAASAASGATGDEPAAYLQFVQEFGATCVARNGVQILVRNSHPTRTLRVWLDRLHMGVGTGDRSRSDLLPGAEPDPLGCSRSLTGPQEWRVVRLQFID